MERGISIVNSNSHSRLRLVAWPKENVLSACKSTVALGLLNGWGPRAKATASWAELLTSRKDPLPAGP